MKPEIRQASFAGVVVITVLVMAVSGILWPHPSVKPTRSQVASAPATRTSGSSKSIVAAGSSVGASTNRGVLAPEVVSDPGASSGSNGVSSAFRPATAPGVTDSTITIGVRYRSQAGDKALGAGGAPRSYDERNVFDAVIDYANAHGGFAGRKLKALYFDYRLSADNTTQDEAACTYFTQQNKVFAMDAADDVRASCAEAAGSVPLGGLTAPSATSQTYATYPHLVDPWEVSLDRLGRVTTTGLVRANYFTGKLGLVTWDDPNYRYAMTAGYLPALDANHVRVVDTAYIPAPEQLNDLARMTDKISQAMAKFRAEGIDHVIIQDGPIGLFGDGALTFQWMNHAENQGYRPRYGQNFNNVPGWSVYPPDQIDQSIAIDDGDLSESNDTGWHANVARDTCYKIEADAGLPVSDANANDELVAAVACDATFYLQRVINSLPDLTTQSFVDATEALGETLESAQIFGTNLFPGRRDGADMVRIEEYLASCRCLKYEGAPYYAG